VLIEPVRCGDIEIPLARPEPSDLAELLDAAIEEAPYWAELWPSARALAEVVAARDLAGCRALEVGCGLGLPALVAAARGADTTASDVDAAPLRYVAASAEAAGLLVACTVLDFAAVPDDARRYDLVLAADVLYVEASAAQLAATLPRLLAPDGRALLTCPWRGQADRLAAALPEAIAVAGRDTVTTTSFRGAAMTVDVLELRRAA
jgi:predicted nicotinamide N-methyase